MSTPFQQMIKKPVEFDCGKPVVLAHKLFNELLLVSKFRVESNYPFFFLQTSRN